MLPLLLLILLLDSGRLLATANEYQFTRLNGVEPVVDTFECCGRLNVNHKVIRVAVWWIVVDHTIEVVYHLVQLGSPIGRSG